MSTQAYKLQATVSYYFQEQCAKTAWKKEYASARRVVTDDGCMRLLVCVLVGIPVRVLLVAAGGQSRLNHRQGTKI